jgi:hypothetical protein
MNQSPSIYHHTHVENWRRHVGLLLPREARQPRTLKCPAVAAADVARRTLHIVDLDVVHCVHQCTGARAVRTVKSLPPARLPHEISFLLQVRAELFSPTPNPPTLFCS